MILNVRSVYQFRIILTAISKLVFQDYVVTQLFQIGFVGQG